MKNKEIQKQLLISLKFLGAIDWHTSTHNSCYIKFKDVRLGSIRISDHKGRAKYSYTYEIYSQEPEVEYNIERIVNMITAKSKTISQFNAEEYVVYSREQGQYVECKDFKEYKDHILKKKEL